MKKRLLALALALILTLGLFSVTAMADGGVTPDYTWYGDGTATEYTISTAAELLGFANIANGADGKTLDTFKDKAIKLGANIDLNSATWTPVGAESAQFCGTFDGQNHTIKNFVLGYTTDSDGYQYCGFFNWIAWPYGGVCNLTLQGITAEVGAKGRFGTVACYAGGGNDTDYTQNMIHDVHVKNITVTSTSADARVGGMFCRTSRSFKDCTVENFEVIVPNGIVTLGGFVSFVYANNQHFQNCKVDGFKVNAANCNNEDGIGGFAGYFNNSYGWTNFYENCTVSGLDITVSGTKAWVGGFVGAPCANMIATNCSAKGKIDASGVTGGFVGGFMGNFGWKAANGAVYSVVHQLTGCTADVDIVSGGAPAGGFIGSASCSNNGSKYGIFENCTASGDVTNTNGAAGGFAGEAVSGQYKNCEATGTVTGKTAGGFIGEAKDYTPVWDNKYYSDIGNANEIKLDSCEANGTVVGSENAGGLVGTVSEKTSADVDGSNGKLVISDSTVSAAVVGTAESTKIDAVVNAASDTKVAENNTADQTAASSVTPPAGETITVENGVVKLPEGTKITSAAGSESVLEKGGEITNGKLIDYVNQPAGDLAWLLPVLGALDKEPFDDVKISDWFYDDVQYAYDNGLMTGTASRTFSPDAAVTRGMVMTILARREGIMTDRYSPWYAAGAEWAVANGISDGSNPEAKITREELATMLYRYAKLKGYDLSGTSLAGYADASSISTYAVSAMQWAVGSGLMNGSNGKLTPRDTATRAQLAAMLHRFFG